MATITLKINEKTTAGKAIKKMLLALVTMPEVEIIKEEKEEYYNPEFVKMIKKSAASKKRYKVDTDDIWGSLGLK